MPPRPGAAGKKAGKPGSDEKREDVLQAVVIADSFQTRFGPFSLEKPRVGQILQQDHTVVETQTD